MADPLLVAREILRGREYYLSHGTAMEIHGMLTQPQLVVTTSTPLVQRPVTALGVQFRFVHCQRQHLFGLTHHWATKQEKVYVSDLERTILDGLKQPHYCGGVTEVARGFWMRRNDIQADRLVAYAKRLGVGAVAQRLGFLLETYELGTQKHREFLLRLVKKASVRLDPVLPATGKFLRRWRLQINIPMEELHATVQT
jgi:predicted transcriptional regulator of viral defense system